MNTIIIQGEQTPLYSLNAKSLAQILTESLNGQHIAFKHDDCQLIFTMKVGDNFIYAAHADNLDNDLFNGCFFKVDFKEVLVEHYGEDSLGQVRAAFSGLPETMHFADETIDSDIEVEAVMALLAVDL